MLEIYFWPETYWDQTRVQHQKDFDMNNLIQFEKAPLHNHQHENSNLKIYILDLHLKSTLLTSDWIEHFTDN